MLEGLSVTLGYRYTWDNKDFDAITYGIASMFPLDRTFGGCRILDENGDPVGNDQPGCRRPNSARWKEPSWTASFEWQATDDLLVYIAHRLGYRSGRLNRRALLPMEFEPVDPELVHDIELGIKADWMLFDVPIRTNVSGFGIRYTNRQAGCSIPGGPGGVFQTIEQNTGSDEITGYEIQVSARPLDALSADAWFSFNRGVTEEVIADPLPGSSVCRTQELDAEFFAPKWRAGVTASYVFPLSPELGEVALIANVNLVDDDKAGDPLDPATHPRSGRAAHLQPAAGVAERPGTQRGSHAVGPQSQRRGLREPRGYPRVERILSAGAENLRCQSELALRRVSGRF